MKGVVGLSSVFASEIFTTIPEEPPEVIQINKMPLKELNPLRLP